ncbi:hypothetical protein BKA56DRAFT_612704 [Ilyonectria sp. MPI-CAGE-AT-0026]|nr:hypothetical protein BKA56DRAFT_612704 [Ilyonectria sp. MPI-CAGE-AT-0026]
MAEEPSVGTRRDSMEVVVKETSESCNPGSVQCVGRFLGTWSAPAPHPGVGEVRLPTTPTPTPANADAANASLAAPGPLPTQKGWSDNGASSINDKLTQRTSAHDLASEGLMVAAWQALGRLPRWKCTATYLSTEAPGPVLSCGGPTGDDIRPGIKPPLPRQEGPISRETQRTASSTRPAEGNSPARTLHFGTADLNHFPHVLGAGTVIPASRDGSRASSEGEPFIGPGLGNRSVDVQCDPGRYGDLISPLQCRLPTPAHSSFNPSKYNSMRHSNTAIKRLTDAS